MGIGNVISSSNISYFQTQVHNDCYHPQKPNGATDQLRNARWPMDDTLCDDLPPKNLVCFQLIGGEPSEKRMSEMLPFCEAQLEIYLRLRTILSGAQVVVVAQYLTNLRN